MNKIKLLLQLLKQSPKKTTLFFKEGTSHTLSFVFLLVIYLVTSFLTALFLRKWFPLPWSIKNAIVQQISAFYQKIVKMNHLNEDSINRTNLIELALYNMRFKKSRTFITVGGMAIGIAAIVYLVSIGYGLQELVVSRVARLEEMKQANVSSPVGGKVRINDQTLNQMKEITGVDKVLPQIAAVGRVNFNNSVSDVVVYGVTSDYLVHSAIKVTAGKIFENNDVSIQSQTQSDSESEPKPEVAGAQTIAPSSPIYFLSEAGNVKFTVNEGRWARVREGPSKNSKIIGYTKRVEFLQSGVRIWGEEYPDNELPSTEGEDGTVLNQWIKTKVKIWEKTTCAASNPDCVDGGYLVLREPDAYQKEAEGYIAGIGLQLQDEPQVVQSSVLGVSTDAVDEESQLELEPAVLQATEGAPGENAASSDTEEFISLEEEDSSNKAENIKKVDLVDTAIKQVVVNQATLQLLGISVDQAIGQKFDLSFIVVGELLENSEEKLESNPAQYEIVGVVPDDRTPIMYVPFIDVRSLGVVNFSQTKVLAKDQNDLPKIRTQLEALGFTTQSVADTVAQINSLFATARTVLFLVGMAALSVASLGMFNTLTVSLLERTREVGLMKAMGMRSSEVHELFLTESMIMGLFGGLAGLTMGVLAGIVTSAILSLYAISSGVGYLNVSYTPPVFIMVILSLAMIVGLVTGLYPARHATRISALNALRYE